MKMTLRWRNDGTLAATFMHRLRSLEIRTERGFPHSRRNGGYGNPI